MEFLPREELEGVCLWPASSLQMIVEKIPAVLWTTNIQLCLTSLAGAGLSTMNLRAKDLVGRPLGEFLPSLASEPTPLFAHTRALAGRASVFDIAIKGRDFKGHVEPLRDVDGTIVGVIGVALDNTESWVAERALRISEQSYRSLFEEAPYGICRATVGGQLLQVNRVMVEMLGYESEADLLLRDLGQEIFADKGSYREFLEQIDGPTPCQGFEASWRRQDKRPLLVRLGGRAVRDDRGETLYLEILTENVTERKQLEDQLRQGQRMQAIGQLAGGIAHDFNNLLTVIKGQVELILSDTAAHNPQRGALEEVQKSADRASMLTQQLLAFSRRQILKSKVLDLNQIISGINQMLARLIGAHFELIFLPGTQLGAVRADPGQIEQVLMNLVVNARDAMPEGGKITIQTQNVCLDAAAARHGSAVPPGDYVALIVSDTGQGMDAETRAHIFEPFFTTKKFDEGTGLGLAVVYGVVKQSGGYIWVHTGPGKGTTFEIYLPKVSEPAETSPAAAPTRACGGNETVLLVEDEQGVRDLISDFLRRMGYQVLVAENGACAIELAHACQGKIDLIVSDLVMPKVGGRELVAELQKIRAHLKVIFISGYPGDAVFQDSFRPTDAPILQKPFSMSYLATAVRHVLDGTEIPAQQWPE